MDIDILDKESVLLKKFQLYVNKVHQNLIEWIKGLC